MNEMEQILKRMLFTGGHGYVVALDKETGDEVWRTSLPGTGYRFVNLLVEDGAIFAASGGRVFCLTPDAGRILWENSMPGLGYNCFGFATINNPANASSAVAAAEESRQRESHHH